MTDLIRNAKAMDLISDELAGNEHWLKRPTPTTRGQGYVEIELDGQRLKVLVDTDIEYDNWTVLSYSINPRQSTHTTTYWEVV